jgi:hypothetical protein
MRSNPAWSLALVLGLSLAGASHALTPVEARRDHGLADLQDIRTRLLAACPAIAAVIDDAAGYAVFKDVGAAGSDLDVGVAVLQRTRQEAFMDFDDREAVAAGTPARDVVFVFEHRKDLGAFLFDGATLGGSAPPSSAGGTCGRELQPGLLVIQLEGDRAVDGVLPRARYRKDDILN